VGTVRRLSRGSGSRHTRALWIAVLVAVCMVAITVAIIHAATQPTHPEATSPPAPPTSAAPQPAVNVALPNAHLTPGQTFVGVTASQACTSGWAGAHRNVMQEQYSQVYAEYGIHYPQPYGTYELDHLIPLELGGDNANANLWPEPASPTPGFHQKDDLENALHDMVCSGSLSLNDAQHEIATNWYAAYLRYVG
jgi:hypothetical protein